MGSKSILNLCSDLEVYKEEECINISLKSTSELGRMLSPKWSSSIRMDFGTFGSINNFMDYISIPNYPAKFKTKPFISVKELEGLEKRKSVPNFYALVAWAVATRISKDKYLQKLMIENTLPYTSMILRRVKDIENPEHKKIIPDINLKMGRYVGIIRTIANDLKNGETIDDKYVMKLVLSCRDKPELPLLHGVAFSVQE